MSNDEVLSSTVLSNIDIIADLYKIVKDAGLKTTSNPEVIEIANTTTIIKPNIPGVNRVTKNCRAPRHNDNECRVSSQYKINYDANDIMIVGGAALNVYDYLLRELKERSEISALENYIKKKTSDIDIVWWPRNVIDLRTGKPSSQEIVTSSSPAISKLVDEFKNNLVKGLDENKEMLQTKLRAIIPNSSSDVLIIEVGGDRYEEGKVGHTWQAGTWTVATKFKIKGREFKICEVLIHDSGASQLFDQDGKQITDLRYMSTDPVYCSPNPSSPNHIIYQDIDGIDVALPDILSFVKQQMLAFSNNMERYLDRYGNYNYKGFINYKRVVFIKKIIESLNLSDPTNTEVLKAVFGTSNTSYPRTLITYIDSTEDRSISRLRPQIKALCETYNTSSDSIIAQLCDKARGIVRATPPLLPRRAVAPKLPNNTGHNYELGKPSVADIEKSREEQMAQLDVLKTRLWSKQHTGQTSSIRRKYQDLYRRADYLQKDMSRMTPDEPRYYYTSPIIEIEEKEHQIDLEAEQHKKQSHLQKKNAAFKNMRPPAISYIPPSQPYHPYGHPGSYYGAPPPPGHYIVSHPGYGAPQLLPFIKIYTDPATGIPWYLDPETGETIMRNPHTGRWEKRGGLTPSIRRGGLNRTYKNKNRNNNTKRRA